MANDVRHRLGGETSDGVVVGAGVRMTAGPVAQFGQVIDASPDGGS